MHLKKLAKDNRGVSLALVIGLFLLLVIITATVNQLVIRALRASHQIEASDKAYFAAEAGVEDALYELSSHSAGYETPDLGDLDVRKADFSEGVSWNNEWEIANRDLNTCEDNWRAGFDPTFCGRIYEGEKLVVNLFEDTADPTGVDLNEINQNGATIEKLDVTSITVSFRLPLDTVNNNGLTALDIDNDGDFGTSAGSGPEGLLGLNEDGVSETDFCGGAVELDDGDCDDREDEDSNEDPVILWSLVDDAGNTFQPFRGCRGDAAHFSHSDVNASLCEKNFVNEGAGEISVSLTEADRGWVTIGGSTSKNTFATFMTNLPANSMVQMEVLVIAPMSAIDVDDSREIPIPYYEYGIDYTAGGTLPSTFFSLRSDGYYRDFKQSITTNVVPRATSRLLDLTIIQQ